MAVRFDVTFEGLGKLRQKLGRFTNTPALAEATGKKFFVEASKIMNEAKRILVEEGHVDEGQLVQSGQVATPEIVGGKVIVRFGFTAPYAVNVHEGRAPGRKMPPEGPIADWARRHGLPPEAVFPIRRAIARRGIAPVKFLERPYLEWKKNALEDIARFYRQQITAMAG